MGSNGSEEVFPIFSLHITPLFPLLFVLISALEADLEIIIALLVT